MNLLTKFLPLILCPLALFAALPPTAEDLREMREIIDSPVLNQILLPEEGVSVIAKDPEETERNAYILESTAHTIGVVVSHAKPKQPGLVGPAPIQLEFYAIPREGPDKLIAKFKETFSSSEPIAAEEGGTPSQDPDIIKLREILNAPNLYSELDGGRVQLITKVPEVNFEEMRDDLLKEENLDEKETAIKEALESASLEKSAFYLIIAEHPNTGRTSQIAALIIYPENADNAKPAILFFKLPGEEDTDD